MFVSSISKSVAVLKSKRQLNIEAPDFLLLFFQKINSLSALFLEGLLLEML